ncbi:hypothetical protein IMZ08_19145 [Bacillus luteolus]|uniref:Group-specific protein n=1 Tax=Litchfieldia luteola TaxID=682179 RepID=A0ABR9QNR9_9BACI|nr:hypothetical protein [Cytobacillus luteolus]MBE4910158.1 hypothetical protein [Cytobacillus luteolus]MBP1942276.1 hypothetical protein [Cytobacillus luteolus]
MFDPTVFDNLKVVVEGEIYDLDLTGTIQVIDRKDIVDFAKMSRVYEISFRSSEHSTALKGAKLRILTDLRSLSEELLNITNSTPGCTVEVLFTMEIDNPDVECKQIEQELIRIWGTERAISQQISYFYGDSNLIKNTIVLSFDRKINEDHMDDLVELIPYILDTLNSLNTISRAK